MKESGWLQACVRFLKKENNLQIAIAIVAALGLLTFVFGSELVRSAKTRETVQTAVPTQTTAEGTDLEGRLEAILSQVENAGQVRVMVTYETGPEIVPALSVSTQENASSGGADGSSTTTQSKTENQEPVVVQGESGSEPLVLVEKEPVVLGVLVVAEGASNIDVRIKLMDAVKTALQISADRIEVLPMSTSK